MNVCKITLDEVSLNHEFREEFEKLGHEFWVPDQFPRIVEWIEVQRAQLVGNLGLRNRKYVVEQNNHDLTIRSFPDMWTRDLRTNDPWTHSSEQIKITFAEFKDLI
jgi:hypothetical protein